MKQIVSFLILLFFFTNFIAQTPADTLQATIQAITIEENRLSLPFSEASRTIDIITRQEIEAAPVVSVAELLRYVAGVDIRQRGAHGIQADISIRGGTFDQTLVLVNGIKLNDPQTGHHNMNLPVDIENIERIEVLKGPAARIFGQNAFTGAVNIITKIPEERFMKIKLQAGQHNLGGVRISAAFPSAKINQYFSFSKDFSEGYRYNTDYNLDNYFYQAQAQLGEHQLKILAGYTERAFGANGFYASPDFRDQYEEIQTSLAAVEYQINQNNWVIKPRVYWRRNLDEYIFVRNNPSIYRNLHIGNTVGTEVNAAWNNEWGMTGLGIDLNRVSLQSNNLGDRNRNVISAFVEHRLQLLDGMIDLTPGLLLNYFSDFDANLLPGIDLGIRLTEQLKLYGNVGYTYRVPTFTDLYYEDRANIGNENLQPEAAFTSEIGMKFQNKNLLLQISGFRRDGIDMIDWTREVDTLQWQPQNFGEVDVQGVDIALNWKPNFTFNWIQQFRLAYTYIDATIIDQEVNFSRYALDNLNHQFIAAMDYVFAKKFYNSLRFRYLDRVALDDYFLVDARTAWRNPKFEVFVDVSNLLNTKYTETNLVEMPGIWIRAGVAFEFL